MLDKLKKQSQIRLNEEIKKQYFEEEIIKKVVNYGGKKDKILPEQIFEQDDQYLNYIYNK